MNSTEKLGQVNIGCEAVSASHDALYLLGCSVSRTLGPKTETRFAEVRIKDRRQHLDYQLDDGGFASSINVSDVEDWQPVRWRLNQVDDEGNVVGVLDGLHEYSDGEPSHGRDSGFRAKPTT